jgi:hypothetical protein
MNQLVEKLITNIIQGVPELAPQRKKGALGRIYERVF